VSPKAATAKTAKPVKAKNVKVKPDRSGKNKRGDGEELAVLSIASHPRAGASVQRIKGIGGLAGFGVAAGLSAKAGVPVDMLGERAILAGIAGYLLAWGCGLSVWRQLVIAEAKVAHELAEERRRKAIEAMRSQEIPPTA